MVRKFMRTAEIAAEIGCSVAHVRGVVAFMKNHKERYGPECYFGQDEEKTQAVRFSAVHDAAQYRSQIKAGLPVPKFNPTAREMDLGIMTPPDIDVDGITKEVARRIMAALEGGTQ